MPISRTTNSHRDVRQLVFDFCWGAWSELGVSEWGRTHQEWAIDPEPLIVFTAGIANLDPRLQDEATDWCIRNWRHISRTRLGNILNDKGRDFLELWGPFAATVNRSAGVRWPEATSPRTYKVTGRSILRPLSEPSLVFLRMRAMFGLGARNEILRYLLLNQGSVSAAALAEKTNYAKRNVSETCDLLVQAGMLQVRALRNRFYYSLANPDTLKTFVGEVPSIVPDWNALLCVVGTIHELKELAQSASRSVLIVETHQAVEAIEKDLDLLNLEVPGRITGAAFLEVWDEWSSSLMKQIAAGKWPERLEANVIRNRISTPKKRAPAAP